MKLFRSLLLVLAVATTAQADVWKKATEPTPQLDLYEALMSAGDEAAITANARNIVLATIIKMVDSAVEKYKAAAKARPKAAEPWFRIASVLNSFFFDCNDLMGQRNLPATCHMGRAVGHRGQETLDAWDKFESLAPLDPRVNEVLLARALLRTKLVGETNKPEKLLRGAAADYIALLDREDGLYQTSKEMVLGNLAETQMMLGEFEASIETYKQAIRLGGGTSATYGLAVTLDRDSQTELAFRVIRSAGDKAFSEFEQKLLRGSIFFVPAGEEEYYFALAHEALGNFEQSIVHWRAFIRSGAHPQFQPRAKEHLDKLMARKNLKIKVPITPDLEEFPSPLRRPRK
jgi:tetratricopeptide (TPR) repeat protein